MCFRDAKQQPDSLTVACNVQSRSGGAAELQAEFVKLSARYRALAGGDIGVASFIEVHMFAVCTCMHSMLETTRMTSCVRQIYSQGSSE